MAFDPPKQIWPVVIGLFLEPLGAQHILDAPDIQGLRIIPDFLILAVCPRQKRILKVKGTLAVRSVLQKPDFFLAGSS